MVQRADAGGVDFYLASLIAPAIIRSAAFFDTDPAATTLADPIVLASP
jgi:hypothetical protein